MSPARSFALVSLLALLAACGKDDKPGTVATLNGVADEALPTPAGAPGAPVTGMPQARTPLPAAPTDALPEAVDENANSGEPAPAEAEPATASNDEPTPQDAVALLRSYYAAINAGDYTQAYGLWSDGGRSSGQTPQQFADGFAQTRGVSVQIGEPGEVEGAAGSRYIEVPVTLEATQRDGSQHRYAGKFTLRRAAVDGATDVQRAWHIASADLQEQ